MSEPKYKVNDGVSINATIKLVHGTNNLGNLFLAETSNGSQFWLKESEIAPDVHDFSYNKGCSDTWDIICKLEDFTREQLFEIFGNYDVCEIVGLYSRAECAKRIEEWESRIEVGDIVETKDHGTALVLNIGKDGSACQLLWSDRTVWPMGASDLRKTGKYVDITSFLKKEIGDDGRGYVAQ